MCCFQSLEQCSKRWDVLVEVCFQLFAILGTLPCDLTNEHVTTAVHCSVDECLGLISGSKPSGLLIVGMDVTFQDLLAVFTTVIQVMGKTS